MLVIQVKIELSLSTPFSHIGGIEVKMHRLLSVVHVGGEVKRLSELFHLQKGICVWEWQTVAKS